MISNYLQVASAATVGKESFCFAKSERLSGFNCMDVELFNCKRYYLDLFARCYEFFEILEAKVLAEEVHIHICFFLDLQSKMSPVVLEQFFKAN